MARSEEIELDPQEPFATAAARVVRLRADELFEHAEGVLDVEDIERVHDMRVASRRLRAALEVFAPCFPRGWFNEALGDVKALADALGERRDPDVHIAALEEFAESARPSSRAGVRLLAGRFRDEQAEANAQLAKALERAEQARLQERLRELVAAVAA